MQLVRRYIFTILLGFTTILLRCATDPGSTTPVSGGSVTFTYATGNVRVVTSVDGTNLTAAAVLFDIDPATAILTQASEIESGVTVTWPEEISFEIPNCNVSPVLSDSITYTVSKVFKYSYPASCTPSVTDTVSGQATLIISKNGSSRTLNDTTSSVTSEVFTSTGTWTAPAGVTSVSVQAWGGGGGGGGGDAPNGGCSGGGGAFASKTVAVTPGTSYSVVIGSGGAGGAGGGGSGGDGGTSYFMNATTVKAVGGLGGDGPTPPMTADRIAGSGGDSALCVGTVVHSGGDAIMNSASAGGGGGSSAGTSADGDYSHFGSGNYYGIAPTGGGNGGVGGGISSPGPGSAGSIPGGGGGGGGSSNNVGGNGANGKIVLNW